MIYILFGLTNHLLSYGVNYIIMELRWYNIKYAWPDWGIYSTCRVCIPPSDAFHLCLF